MRRAQVVSEDSPDAETQVGAVLVHGDTGAVLASGFNGFIRGADDDNLPNTRPEKYPYMVHAETNLVYNCARHGVSTEGCFVVCTLSPCVNCLRAVYQCGITEVYFRDTYRDFGKNIAMQDLDLILTQVGKYTKITLRPKLKGSE